MELLLDESADEKLRFRFVDHDCQTASFAKMDGLKNGQLLTAAEAAGFDVLITPNQNMPDQQNLSERTISIVILQGPTNRLRDPAPLPAQRFRRSPSWAVAGDQNSTEGDIGLKGLESRLVCKNFTPSAWELGEAVLIN